MQVLLTLFKSGMVPNSALEISAPTAFRRAFVVRQRRPFTFQVRPPPQATAVRCESLPGRPIKIHDAAGRWIAGMVDDVIVDPQRDAGRAAAMVFTARTPGVQHVYFSSLSSAAGIRSGFGTATSSFGNSSGRDAVLHGTTHGARHGEAKKGAAKQGGANQAGAQLRKGLLCKATRAWLPPSQLWLFAPRQDTHDADSWYLEWAGHDRVQWPSPDVFVMYCAFVTLDGEAGREKGTERGGGKGGLASAQEFAQGFASGVASSLSAAVSRLTGRGDSANKR